VRSLPGKSQKTLFRLEHQYCSCAEFNRRVNVSQTPSRHGSAPPSGAGICGHVAAGRSAIKTRRGCLAWETAVNTMRIGVADRVRVANAQSCAASSATTSASRRTKQYG
jgi:hypothetical protein